MADFLFNPGLNPTPDCIPNPLHNLAYRKCNCDPNHNPKPIQNPIPPIHLWWKEAHSKLKATITNDRSLLYQLTRAIRNIGMRIPHSRGATDEELLGCFHRSQTGNIIALVANHGTVVPVSEAIVTGQCTVCGDVEVMTRNSWKRISM